MAAPTTTTTIRIIDGELYYDGAWLNGPFFYRDYGGRRQYWIHGGWHFAQGRGGHYRQALGRDWYQNHNSGNRGYAGRSGGFGDRSYGNYRDYSQRSNGFQQRSFQAQPQQSFWRRRQSGLAASGYSRSRRALAADRLLSNRPKPQQSFRAARRTRGNLGQRWRRLAGS